MFAEANDLQMFNCLLAGLSQHNSSNPHLQKDAIIKSRAGNVETMRKSSFTSLEKNNESTSYNCGDDSIFKMSL